MFDFRQTVIDALDRVIDSGAVQEAIEAAMGKALNSAIENQLRSYSEFGKAVEAAVKKALVIHGKLDLPSYNDLILRILKRQSETLLHSTLERQVAGRMQELLTPAPETITLTDLVKLFVDDTKERNSAGCVCHGDEHRIFFELREDDRNDGKFPEILLGREYTGDRKRDAEMRIGLYLGHAEPRADEQRAGEIYHMTFSEVDIEKHLFSGPFYGFEKLLFQMKAAKTRVVIDCDPSDIETSYDVEYA